MAHARRKFFDLHASKKSQIAEQALKFFVALYDVEREAADLDPEQRRAIREERGRPIAQALHVWMLAQRKLVSEGSAIANALDYNLKRWQALTRYLDDPHVPIGRVEMWRGGGRVGLSVAAPFVWRCPNNLTIAPFPHPAHRTGRADFPLFWYRNEPLPVFDYRTPEQLVSEGRADDIIRFVASLEAGAAG